MMNRVPPWGEQDPQRHQTVSARGIVCLVEIRALAPFYWSEERGSAGRDFHNSFQSALFTCSSDKAAEIVFVVASFPSAHRLSLHFTACDLFPSHLSYPPTAMEKRRQNQSCDQCRRSKKACDGYLLNRSQPSPDSGATAHGKLCSTTAHISSGALIVTIKGPQDCFPAHTARRPKSSAALIHNGPDIQPRLLTILLPRAVETPHLITPTSNERDLGRIQNLLKKIYTPLASCSSYRRPLQTTTMTGRHHIPKQVCPPLRVIWHLFSIKNP